MCDCFCPFARRKKITSQSSTCQRRTFTNSTKMAQLAMNRPEVIQSLIDGVDRYNPDNISILEEYLATQCQNEEYDLMANLAALKLYVEFSFLRVGANDDKDILFYYDLVSVWLLPCESLDWFTFFPHLRIHLL